MNTTVPREKVVAIAENVRELHELFRQQKATQAELIRWCVQELRADTNTHRLRGFEDWHTKRQIIAENRENKAKALLYLEWLATQLEDQSVRDPDSI